uniref:Uncharacterized protein n=1 Tax=Ixodes ricinus TaxID=34613 RepID=A0A6B0U9X2_IXORI
MLSIRVSIGLAASTLSNVMVFLFRTSVEAFLPLAGFLGASSVGAATASSSSSPLPLFFLALEGMPSSLAIWRASVNTRSTRYA